MNQFQISQNLEGYSPTKTTFMPFREGAMVVDDNPEKDLIFLPSGITERSGIYFAFPEQKINPFSVGFDKVRCVRKS